MGPPNDLMAHISSISTLKISKLSLDDFRAKQFSAQAIVIGMLKLLYVEIWISFRAACTILALLFLSASEAFEQIKLRRYWFPF